MKIAQAFDLVWQAIEGYRENCIPESDSLYDEEYEQICEAMKQIHGICVAVQVLRNGTDESYS
jgi:hypothetical protein